MMDKKAVMLMVVCLIALFGSFLFAMFNPSGTMFLILPLTIMIIVFFFFGVIGFGFASFVPYVLLGLAMGTQKNAVLFLYLIPILIATYAGLKLGSTLLDDFRRKIYFTEHWKIIVSLLITAIIIAVAIELALPMLEGLQLWPADLFGMEFNQTNVKDIFSYLEQI
jgi:hypothetical protein